MTKLKFYLSVLLTVLTICSQAQQSGIIKGRVLIATIFQCLVNVVLTSISKGAISDSYGYTITGVPAKHMNCFATYIGYTPETYKYRLSPVKQLLLSSNLRLVLNYPNCCNRTIARD